jgi:hypothetical protein
MGPGILFEAAYWQVDPVVIWKTNGHQSFYKEHETLSRPGEQAGEPDAWRQFPGLTSKNISTYI